MNCIAINESICFSPSQILEYQSSVAGTKSDSMENYLRRKSGRSETSSSSFAPDASPARSATLDEKRTPENNRSGYSHEFGLLRYTCVHGRPVDQITFPAVQGISHKG